MASLLRWEVKEAKRLVISSRRHRAPLPGADPLIAVVFLCVCGRTSCEFGVPRGTSLVKKIYHHQEMHQKECVEV